MSSRSSSIDVHGDSLASSMLDESSAPTSPAPSSLTGLLTKPSRPPASGDRRSGPSGHRFATTCATVDDPNHKDQYGASSTPLYMSATFKGLPGAEFDYSRSGNPTRSMLQHHLCQLQACRYSFAVSSGMACLDVVTRVLKPGERIIAGDDLYGGTNRLLTYLATHGGIKTDHVDTTDAAKVEALLELRAKEAKEGKCGPVKMLLLETPTNPLLKICDLERCASAAKRFAPDAIVVVDNTMMSPYLMRPLELGADVVYDSGTKYLSGHHDLMAGVIACDRDDVGKQIAFTINSVGNALTPMDSFLLLRGIKTLAVRMDRQQASARLVAAYLEQLGFKVNYPGLESHRGKEIHDKQASGPGAVLSFETGNKELSERVVGATRLWGISVSFGCVNSLISMPCLMSHASIDPKVRKERNLPEDLIRLCVGIEDCRDLLEDLEAALVQAGAIRRRATPVVPLSAGAVTAEEQAEAAANFERLSIAGTDDESIPASAGGVDASKTQTRGGDPAESEKVVADAAATDDAVLANAPSTLVVSAPGKVILFGEHAVVHGVTAIAASVALRCYAHVTPRSDGKVSLSLPDLDVEHEWDVASLPWSEAPAYTGSAPAALDEALVKSIEACVGAVAHESSRSHAASVAFLYLLLNVGQRAHLEATRGLGFTLRSALPIGAGLGSSAALSSCLASALLFTQGRLPAPVADVALAPASAELINAFAFVGEKVIHGNPSGVDNAVSVHGGAIAFARAHARTKRTEALMAQLKGFASVRFLLTDTRVPRDTKSLVAGVGAKLAADPQGVESILSAIQQIADEAEGVLGGRTASVGDDARKTQLDTLARLMDANHERLVQLGVSHPSLEAVRSTTAQAPFKLSTKLTGAGGGGCAVTLVPDSLEEAQLALLIQKLETQGFVCYQTSIGGAGVAALDTSSTLQADEVRSATDVFKKAKADELEQWAEKLGSWVTAL